jgi:hypothetical protein
MSIAVKCGICGWNGTVVDSLAGERIACRACAESLFVPAENEDPTDFEVVEDARKAKIAEPPPETEAEIAARKAKEEKKKRDALLPKKRNWLFTGKNLMILGIVAVISSFASIVVNAFVNEWKSFPLIAFIIGCVITFSGYVIKQEQLDR